MRHSNLLAAAGCAAVTAAMAAPALACDTIRINEVRIAQPGPNLDQYFELVGPPGFVLNNVTYIVIGDAPGVIPPFQNGHIENIIDLDGVVIPPDGVLLVAKPTFTLAAPDLVVDFTFEDFDNVTHLLVVGFTGSLNQDLDTDNDGVLDVTPWSAILCDVAFVIDPNPNGITQEFFYSDTIVGPDGASSPSHAWVCSDTLEWKVGSATLGIDDTPGEPNPVCLGESSVRLNEIRIDQPGEDADEYFELAGPPGASLSGLTYVVIGDSDAGGSGVIEAIVPLDGFAIPASGYFLVAEDTDTFGAVADLLADLNFENADNVTHLLVQGFSGALDQDLDLNDDGVLDVVAWSAVVDSIGLVTPDYPPTLPGSEWVYSDVIVGPDGSFVPSHVYRCEDTLEWFIGPFNPAAGIGRDTPGAANLECTPCTNLSTSSCFVVGKLPGCLQTECCESVCSLDPSCCEVVWDANCVAQADATCLVGGEAPDVILNEIRIDEPGVDLNEYFELVGAPGTSLTGLTYVVLGDQAPELGSGVIEAIIPLDGYAINANGFFVVAEETFQLGGADVLLPGENPINFENADNVTHMLVWNFTGALNDDLDLNDNGTLDVTPWQSIVDSVGIIGPNYPPNVPAGQEWVYSDTIVGPEVTPGGSFVPAHVYRCGTRGTWTIGPFDVLGAGVDTPGAANPDCPVIGPCDDPGAPECTTAHSGVGCNDADCCNTVCDQDPACCEVQWDADCATAATALCTIGGGDLDTLALWTFEVSVPSSAGPHDAEDGVYGGDALGIHASRATVFSNPVGNGSGESFSSNTWSAGDSYQFTTSTLGYENIEFGWSQTRSGTGPADFVAEWSADGVNFETLLSYTVAQISWTGLSTNAGSIFEPIALPAAASDLPTIWVRLTSTAKGTPSGGTNRVDDVFYLGSVIDGKTPCPADLNGDGIVDGADLGLLLNAWGTSGNPADLNGDGLVDGADLGLLLNAWGTCG